SLRLCENLFFRRSRPKTVLLRIAPRVYDPPRLAIRPHVTPLTPPTHPGPAANVAPRGRHATQPPGPSAPAASAGATPFRSCPTCKHGGASVHEAPLPARDGPGVSAVLRRRHPRRGRPQAALRRRPPGRHRLGPLLARRQTPRLRRRRQDDPHL